MAQGYIDTSPIRKGPSIEASGDISLAAPIALTGAANRLFDKEIKEAK
jgi:hypothetical protein